MCSAACASSRFLPSEAYGGSFPTTPIPGCMSYWISWALITGCTHGLQVRASSERLEGRRLKKKPTDSTGQGCEMVDEEVYLNDYVTPRQTRQSISDYLEYYNERRPHQALNYQTPATVYAGTGVELSAIISE